MKFSSHAFIDEFLPEAWLYGDALLLIDHEQRLFAAKGFSVAGHPMSDLSFEHLATWRSAAMSMLNSLELHTHLHFYWTIESDYSDFIQGHKNGGDPTAPALARHLLEERIAGYERAQKFNELRSRKLFVFVNLEPAQGKLSTREEFKRGWSVQRDHRLLMTEWKAAQEKLDQLTRAARHPFEACGMNTTLLGSQDIRGLYRRLFSPHRHLLHVPGPQTAKGGGCLWNETLFSDVERRPPFLRFDEHFHAFLSMANVPQETQTGFLSHLFHLSFSEYALALTVRTTEKQKEIQQLQSAYGSKRGLQISQERGGKPSNVEMEAQAEEIRNEIRILTQSPQQIFHLQMVVHLWHPNEAELLRRVDETLIKMGYCGGIQGALEHIAAPEALRACLPGWTREERLDRFQAVKSVNAADFIPAHTDFLGTGRPQLLFPTPEGGLMTAHVYSASRPYHNVVVGETGGGKTFLLNSIVTQLVGQGLKSVSVISTKNEFGPLVSIYGGEQISFSDDNPVFLNPCAIAGDQPRFSELAAMTAILEVIFGELTDDTERKIRRSRILKAAHSSFGKYRSGTRLRHFVEAFRIGWEHDDPQELKRLAMILEPYTQGGHYGEFFDSDTKKPLDLSNSFKFFDFSGIQENEDLAAVMMMALTMGEAQRLSQLPRHYRKALLLDECWAFVDSRTGGNFIQNALRVYRAFNCAVFLSTQVISDFLDSRIAPIVMSNCHNFFLLRTMNPNVIAIMQKELGLTDRLASRFASMPNPAETNYSKFIYVHRADAHPIAGEAIHRIGRAESILYSTSPRISQLRDAKLRGSTDPWKEVTRLASLSDEELDRETHKLFSTTQPRKNS